MAKTTSSEVRSLYSALIKAREKDCVYGVDLLLVLRQNAPWVAVLPQRQQEKLLDDVFAVGGACWRQAGNEGIAPLVNVVELWKVTAGVLKASEGGDSPARIIQLPVVRETH